ncbi:TPA: VanZ family protein [Burkholderia vietnamiensis]|nr:VanZ family protein [Burkholderia vietnamiensis]
MNAIRMPRASSLALQAFAAYAALVVYASLYPFEGWVSLGIGPFDYLFAPLQRYVTVFDVATNVLGYMPFGALGVLALHPRWRGVAATLVVTGLGVLLSGTMEALQTYLPTRVASNLDLGANALGALMLFAALAIASLPMRASAPRVRLLIAFVAATLALKAAATFMQSSTGLVVVWATPGARLGIELGFAAALVALRVPPAWRALLAAVALLAGVALVNLLPVNPFFDFTLSGWRQGRYVHFNSLARWLAWIWPYAALLWLGQRVEHAWLPGRGRS